MSAILEVKHSRLISLLLCARVIPYSLSSLSLLLAVNTLLLYIIIAAINWRSRYLSTSSIHRGFRCSNIHRQSAAYTHYPEVVPSLALARDNLG